MLPRHRSVFFSEQLHKAAQDVAWIKTDDFEKTIEKIKPKYCFISSLTCQINRAIEMCKLAKSRGVEIVALGGVFATLVGKFAELTLDMFDYIIAGAGESACVDIIQATERHISLDKIICTSRQGTLSNDCFKFKPDFSIFPHDLAQCLDIPATIEYSRGCTHNCKFCTLVERSRGISFEKPDRLAAYEEELLYWGYKRVIVCDDTFLSNLKVGMNQLCAIEKRTGEGLSKTVMTRIDLITHEMVKLLKKHNVTEVLLGVEHVNRYMLERMGKTPKPDEWKKMVEKSLKLLSDNEIVSHPIYMLGWCGETEKTLMDLVDFAIKNGQPDNIQPFVAFCTPHPRSNLWLERNDLGLNLFPASLASYTHLSPVAYPITLGKEEKALERLVQAHNAIRLETNGFYRNPLINLKNPYIAGPMNDLLLWDGDF